MQKVRWELSKVVAAFLLLAFLRFLPVKQYNTLLKKLINRLSPLTLSLHWKTFVEVIKFSKKTSRGYKNSYFEAEALVKKFDRLRPHYLNLVAEVKKHRKKFGLVI